MWKVLAPIILLVIVLLLQLQLQEAFVTNSTSDASGNITDASGTPLSQSTKPTISLTLAELLSLFKATASTPTPMATEKTGGSTTTLVYTSTTTNPAEPTASTPSSFPSASMVSSSSTESSNGAPNASNVGGIMNTMLQGSPYSPAKPLPNDSAPCSDSAAQGVEFQNALQDYIRKDEIPCYGCTL